MLRVKGLECLVSLLKCMVEWSREYYIDPATTGLNTVRVIRGEDPGLPDPNEGPEEEREEVGETKGSQQAKGGSFPVRSGELGSLSNQTTLWNNSQGLLPYR